jgi:membrane-bound inhibitor of C-type lysozyme
MTTNVPVEKRFRLLILRYIMTNPMKMNSSADAGSGAKYSTSITTWSRVLLETDSQK